MIPFPFNENRFSFFLLQTIYLLASCVQIPRAIRAFYHVWKWHNVQRVRSEMHRCTTHALYQSKLWQQNHCQHSQNANPDGSTCPGWWKQSFRLRLWSLVWFQVRATSCYLTSSKSAWKSTPKSVVIPRCNRVAGGRPWVWQQDSAPVHKSKETQAWLQKECYDFVPFSHWPLSSPDLNPRDYFIWSYDENITNMTSHNTKASLIAAIGRVFAELPPALVEKACSQFRIRIEAVTEAEDGYIE